MAETYEIEVTDAVARQIDAAAELTDADPTAFIEDATLNRLEALDNVLHTDMIAGEVPEDFDADAWRERHREIIER